MGVMKDEGRENARPERIFQTNGMSEVIDARNIQMFERRKMKLQKGKKRFWNLNRNRFVAEAKAEVDAEAEAHQAEAEAKTKAEAEAYI